MSSPRFISIEGIDGAGKSTHIAALTERLVAAGATVLNTREPGGTELAERLRELVLHSGMDGLTEALLVFAGRRDHLQRVIEPALAAGKTVLCDRFTDATFAYQGAGRGFDPRVLGQLEQWVQTSPEPGEGFIAPDLTLWFDVPAEVAAQRRAAARQADRLEREDLDFFQRVRAGYARRAEEQPDRFVRIDADKTLDAVWQQVRQALEGRPWA